MTETNRTIVTVALAIAVVILTGALAYAHLTNNTAGASGLFGALMAVAALLCPSPLQKGSNPS